MAGHQCGGGEGCCGGSKHGADGGCGCGGGCGGAVPPSDNNPLQVTIHPLEEAFLAKLAQTPFLPVAQFVLHSQNPTQDPHMSLEPVYLETGKETLEEVKKIGEVMLSLADKNIISLDYDRPLEGSDPNLFQASEAFAMLQKTVEEGKTEENFPYEPPVIFPGSVCLTALGDLVIEQLDFS